VPNIIPYNFLNHGIAICKMVDELDVVFKLDIDEFNSENTFVAIVDDEVVGFLFARKLYPEAELTFISVKKEFRSNGIGFLLGQALISYCRNYGISHISCALKRDGAKVPLRTFLTQLGFVPGIVKHGYWCNQNLTTNIMCDICGTPCHCSLQIFHKHCN
jgi:GNAT superfamily N-acetyltransferase